MVVSFTLPLLCFLKDRDRDRVFKAILQSLKYMLVKLFFFVFFFFFSFFFFQISEVLENWI